MRSVSKLIIVLVFSVVGLATYQNCGDFSALSNGSASLGSSSLLNESGGLINGASLDALKDAEAAVATRTQDPAKSLDVTLADRGVCIVRGGAGKFLAPANFKSRAECLTSCASFTTYTNRSCLWRDQFIFGNPTATCLVRGGAFAVLSNRAGLSRNDCTTECDRFGSAANRTCDWGEERIHDAPAGSECRVYGGAGAAVFEEHPIIFASRAECQVRCDQHADREYRTCRYGRETLREPPPESRCEILGGAGLVLKPVFFGSRQDCDSACAQFPQNPNRFCWHGKVRIK